MATKVIRIKQAPPGWQTDKQYVYIGRGGKGMNGYFGNPIIVGQRCDRCGQRHTSGGSTLDCYREYLKEKLQQSQVFSACCNNLKDKTLVCFCKPKPCHGDVLAKYVDEGII